MAPTPVAAVIVEPMAGSTGVLPAPKNYLKRLREITQKHGILLIFDEVITGFGRLGFAFAAERYGVTPDMLTFAKGITNGAAPMGGVLVRDTIHDAFMSGPEHVANWPMATPTRPIRWPARRASPRSTSTATKSCSSAPTSSSRNSPTP
jgi:adenosylmethionine-8-amino-7-oxononanoate aminotransferase